MTTPRRDNHSTPFGLWLRDQQEIDSRQGYITTDIDYIWKNYITNEWMLIEEKRHGKIPSKAQLSCLSQIDQYLWASKLYRGCFAIVFENTTPEDGNISVGKINLEISLQLQQISKEDFLSFLRFEYDL